MNLKINQGQFSKLEATDIIEIGGIVKCLMVLKEMREIYCGLFYADTFGNNHK